MNAASGDVWFTLGDNGALFHEGMIYNYYLTTYGNTAMMQTGHSQCNRAEIERKIVANTIFYLKQSITEEEFDY